MNPKPNMKMTTTIQVAKKPCTITFDTDTIWQDFLDAGFTEHGLYARLIQKLSYDIKPALVKAAPASLTLADMLEMKGQTGRVVSAEEVKAALAFLRDIGIGVTGMPETKVAEWSATVTFDEATAAKLVKGMAKKLEEDEELVVCTTLEDFTMTHIRLDRKLKREAAADFGA
jgi:hypothetical protein